MAVDQSHGQTSGRVKRHQDDRESLAEGTVELATRKSLNYENTNLGLREAQATLRAYARKHQRAFFLHDLPIAFFSREMICKLISPLLRFTRLRGVRNARTDGILQSQL